MGKQKRARQKYHLARSKGRFNDDDTKSESGTSNISMEIASEKSFKPGLCIDNGMDVDNLKKLGSLDDDRKSVISISKSIKRSIAESGSNIHLKKKDKRELRRDLFIKKVDAIHQIIHKNKKSKQVPKDEAVLEDLPQENMLFFKSEFKEPKGPRPVSLKQKSTAKAKKRKEDMLKNIEAFKKVISQQNSLGDVMGSLTESIEKKVFNEVL